MITSRRSFLTGLGAALITAPAIVRAGSLMPVRQMMIDPLSDWIETNYHCHWRIVAIGGKPLPSTFPIALTEARINAAYGAMRHAMTERLYS